MSSILLAVYAVRVKAAHTRRDFELLDSFSDKGADLYDFLPPQQNLWGDSGSGSRPNV